MAQKRKAVKRNLPPINDADRKQMIKLLEKVLKLVKTDYQKVHFILGARFIDAPDEARVATFGPPQDSIQLCSHVNVEVIKLMAQSGGGGLPQGLLDAIRYATGHQVQRKDQGQEGISIPTGVKI